MLQAGSLGTGERLVLPMQLRPSPARAGRAACHSPRCLPHGPQGSLALGLVMKCKWVRRVHHQKHGRFYGGLTCCHYLGWNISPGIASRHKSQQDVLYSWNPFTNPGRQVSKKKSPKEVSFFFFPSQRCPSPGFTCIPWRDKAPFVKIWGIQEAASCQTAF